jgi:RNA polymerase sigma-70 factor, ECF subfamily
LPEEQRTAVELHHLKDESVTAIAEHLGRSEASVAGLLRRGLKKLRELLKEKSEPKT